MNKLFNITLIASLLIANIYWIFKLHNFAERNMYQNSQIDQLKSSINLINYCNELQFIVTNHQIDINIDIIDEDGQLTKLNSIFNTNKELLVVRYGELNCKTCLNEYINKLTEILPDTLIANKTIFIVNNSNIQNLSQFKRINKVKNRVFRFENSLTPIDSINIPYFFILKDDGEIRQPYVPVLSNDELTRKYFKGIKQKLS